MDNADIVKRVMEELGKITSMDDSPAAASSAKITSCGVTEFVGTTEFGETIGLVIANVDSTLQEMIGIDKKYRSLGIIGSRTGAGPQAMAADEAVKSTNTELIMFEMPRDTKIGGGHGTLMVFGADEVSDVRRAVEITLEILKDFFGEVYMNDAGHIEVDYTARASSVLAKNFKAPIGKAWGLVASCPAAIGMVMADIAVKSADVELLMYASPGKVTSHSNEFMVMFTGDSGAVKQSVLAGRDVGIKLLTTMGGEPKSAGTPHLS